MKRSFLIILILLISFSLQAQVIKTIKVEPAGSLATLLVNNADLVNDLTLSGSLNIDDVKTIRAMKNLQLLNLSDATIVASGSGYYSIKDNEISSIFGLDLINLISIQLPNSLVKIGDNAFQGCKNLTSVTISANVTSIGRYAFSYCTGLKEFIVDSNNAYFSSIDGVLFNKQKSTLILYPNLKSTNYSIPSTVNIIGESSFNDCSNLSSVTIPNTVTAINYYAFNHCTGLSSITIPNSATIIGAYAFNGCSGLISIEMPSSVTIIEAGAFIGCTKLPSIVLPGNINVLNEETFLSCTELKKIHCQGKTPLRLSPYCFSEETIKSGILYVPKGTIDAYRNADVWKDFLTILEEDGTSGIDDNNALYDYTSFNGIKYSMNVLEKKNVVLLYPSDKVITSEVALDSIASRADRMYEYYKNTLGFEPWGGLSTFSNKCPVAFVNETCGAACGLIGAKGIEVGLNFLDEMVFEYLNNANRNRIGIIGYEFGRNFYMGIIQSKLGFKTDGSVLTNGFATFLGLKATFYARTVNETNRLMNETQFFYDECYSGTLAFIVDPSMDINNFFFANHSLETDFNRVPRVIYPGASILIFLDKVLATEGLFPNFWKYLRDQPNASTDQDVYDNIVVSSSLAVGKNLTRFFRDVLKFTISSTATSKISYLPSSDNFKLIHDIKNYEVVNLEGNIPIVTASIGQSASELLYKAVVRLNKNIIFEGTTQKAFIQLPIPKCFSTCENSNERELIVYSMKNNVIIDSMTMNLHYRDTISTEQYLEFIAKNSWFGSYAGSGYTKIDKNEKLVQIFSTGEALDDNAIAFPFQPVKGHNYIFKALVKTSSNARGFMRYTGAYNTPITSSDPTKYTPIELTIDFNKEDTTRFSESGFRFFSFVMGNDAGVGPQFAYFKNVELIDVTNSSIQWNNKPAPPIVSFENGHLKSSYTSSNQWFYNNEIINGAINQEYIPTQTGKYTVKATQGLCNSDISDPYNFILSSVPNPEISDNVLIYPNPAKEILTIQVKENKGIIKIYDMFGKCLNEQKVVETTIPINISTFPSGTYIIKIMDGKNTVHKKFIKE